MYKEKFVTAIVAAAGMGKRMKMGINKQFLAIDGIPILAHTIKKIEKSKYIDFLLLIVKKTDRLDQNMIHLQLQWYRLLRLLYLHAE